MRRTGDINESGKNSINVTGGKVKGDIKIGLDEKALIENARKNLHEAVTEKYISADKVSNCCAALKKLLPEDPLANFYETAVSGTPQELAQSLSELDCHSFGPSDLEEMATFLIKSLKREMCNSVAMFIDRIGGVNPSLHERVATIFDKEVPKVDEGIYDLTLPRDVFVAYRSTDLDKVVKLVDYLESTEKLECFVSYRNLQHGIGAKDHYDEWLKMAMDSCKVLVFVSSVRSRREGDARHKELPYVKKKDEAHSPGEYQAFGDYTKIPKEYKKPRVEYLIESYTSAKSEGFAKEFFDGFTQRESPEAVAQAIFRILGAGVASPQKKKTVQPATNKRAVATKEAEKQSEAEAARLAEEQRKAEAAKQAEAQRKAEEAARLAEELKKKPWLAPDYPTLGNYDKMEFRIEGTELKRYLKEYFGGEVKIPRGVTSIGDRAFYDCRVLKSVIIPDSVTHIGIGGSASWLGAFRGCSGLTSITIPDSVESIGDYAFSDCNGLTSITIPDSVKSIGGGAFFDCNGLTSIIIPKSVTSIGVSAFSGCSGLTKIEVDEKNSVFHAQGNCLIETKSKTLISGCKTSKIPQGVTSISDLAFSNCRGLTSITIPDSVKSIGDYAFSGCRGLTSVKIPDSVTSIKREAFGCCSGLTKIEVDENNPAYHAEGNCLIEKKSRTLISGCETSKIPWGVTSIGRNAFAGCSGLTSIAIPDSVTSIGDEAFEDCSWLMSVKIPNSVKSIGGFAFYCCSGLTSITIPDSVESIGGRAFEGCKGLTSITIPKSVKSIGDWAFRNCKNLLIYCEARKKPIRWHKNWNPDDCPVVWGYKKK